MIFLFDNILHSHTLIYMKKAVVGTFVSLFLANPSFAQGIIKCQTEEVIESTQVLAIELL